MKTYLMFAVAVMGSVLSGCTVDTGDEFAETIEESKEGLTYTFGSLPALPDGLVAASGTAPSLVRDTCGLHAFVRASNDRIYTATETGGSWSAWSGFGWA
ncbi:MAG TPA: hypothetical protein VFZ53_06980, partial [Polyangiaceae bacterium]